MRFLRFTSLNSVFVFKTVEIMKVLLQVAIRLMKLEIFNPLGSINKQKLY